MKLAYIVFNSITWLDFIGIYDPLSRLRSLNFIPDLKWDICAYADQVSDNFGLEITPTKVKNSLGDYDAIIVPGGFGTRKLQHNNGFIDWIKTADDVQLKTSVCTGSLILGAAGFLKGKRATTNFKEYEALELYCDKVVKDRIVEDENVITSGTVSSSIDLGLYLCKKWAGTEAEKAIRTSMDYNG